MPPVSAWDGDPPNSWRRLVTGADDPDRPATPEEPPAQPAQVQQAPPAAKAVLSGGRTELEVQLEGELAAERERHARTEADKKSRETRISELEDELHRLRRAQQAAKPAKKGFRLTFMEDEED